MHKESHQHIDVVSMFKPVTKWNVRLNSSRVIPEVVRKAFKVAQAQKPGPTHIELPEDVMAEMVDAEPLPVQLRVRRPEPSGEELLEAASLIRSAGHPIVLAGNGVARVGAAAALREFARATGIGVAETFMGKGLLDYQRPARARHGRAAVARLRAGGLRGRRRRDHGRLRPRRARAEELEPRARQADRLHRHGLARGRRALHDRGRPRRRHRAHPLPPGRGAARRRLGSPRAARA